MHFFSATRSGFVEVLYLIDDQHPQGMKVGYLAHAGQQALGPQFLAAMTTAIVGSEHPVDLVEEAQAQLVQIPIDGTVDLQVGQLGDIVLWVVKGLRIHSQDTLQCAGLTAA